MRGDIERVETQVAMAFGASVQPLTRMTPNVSKEMMINAGLAASCCKYSVKVIVIVSSPNWYICDTVTILPSLERICSVFM